MLFICTVCFRVFKLQLKVTNKKTFYLHSVSVNQINQSCTSINYIFFNSKFLVIR